MREAIKTLSIIILVATVAYQALGTWDAKGVSRFLGAYSSFLKDAAALNCLRADQVKALAKERGWEVSAPDPHRPYLNGENLRVFVSPAMPISKEPGIGMRFDDNGCWNH